MERRGSDREDVWQGAQVGQRKERENAIIEERGERGVRILSGTPLRKNDSIVLFLGDERIPVPAKVVWVRKSGIIDKRVSGRPGQAFVAGCRFKTRQGVKAEERGKTVRFRKRSLPNVLPFLLVGGAVLAVAAVCYFLISLVFLFV